MSIRLRKRSRFGFDRGLFWIDTRAWQLSCPPDSEKVNSLHVCIQVWILGACWDVDGLHDEAALSAHVSVGGRGVTAGRCVKTGAAVNEDQALRIVLR